MTHDVRHIVYDEQALKISALLLFRFGTDKVWNIFEAKDCLINQSINQSRNGDDCRTAPATPGLLIMG